MFDAIRRQKIQFNLNLCVEKSEIRCHAGTLFWLVHGDCVGNFHESSTLWLALNQIYYTIFHSKLQMWEQKNSQHQCDHTSSFMRFWCPSIRLIHAIIAIKNWNGNVFSYCVCCRKFASINIGQKYNAELGCIVDWHRHCDNNEALISIAPKSAFDEWHNSFFSHLNADMKWTQLKRVSLSREYFTTALHVHLSSV